MDAFFPLKGESLKKNERVRVQPFSWSFLWFQGLLLRCISSPNHMFYVKACRVEYAIPYK